MDPYSFLISKAVANEPAVATKPTLIENFIPFIFIIVIIYFLFIRPHQKNQKRQVGFLGGLKVGDEVLTSSGVLGKIDGLTDQYVVLKVSEQTKLRILKSHISSYSQDHLPAQKG